MESVSAVALSVCGKVEGRSDDVAFSEVIAVVIWPVVVESFGVLVVFTGDALPLFIFVTTKLVGFAALVVIVIICSSSGELVLPAEEQKA